MNEQKEIVSERQISKYDRSNILGDYRRWPTLAQEALEREVYAAEASNVGRIVLCGMGGSAASCDVVRNWVNKIDVVVIKGYHLPRWVGRSDLIIAVTYSGDTEETLSCYSEALKKGLPLVTISSGGTIEASSRKRGVPHNKVAAGLAPRAAFPLLFYTLVKVLRHMEIIGSGEFEEAKSSARMLSLYSERIFPEVPLEMNISKQVTAFMYHRIPKIYGSEEIGCAVERFRRMISENGKWHAMSDVLPELCHNDIVSYVVNNPQLRIILMRTKLDRIEISKRFDIIRDILLNSGHKVMELIPEGSSLLDHIISYIYFLDVATVYLAIKNGQEPAKTENIDYLKRRLGRELKYVSKLPL
ncbi:MAG: bifunctional phosphoglucose/phosphomannose isomerase [Nitrososphaeria archaeon]